MINFLYAANEAAGAQGQQGSGMQFLVMIVLIFVVYYFLLIRPQRQKTKELQKKRDSLKKGDRIVTNGGIYATVNHLKKDGLVIVCEIAENVKVEFSKSAVAHVIDPEAEAKKNSDAK